jgi:hypothetical protein
VLIGVTPLIIDWLRRLGDAGWRRDGAPRWHETPPPPRFRSPALPHVPTRTLDDATNQRCILGVQAATVLSSGDARLLKRGGGGGEGSSFTPSYSSGNSSDSNCYPYAANGTDAANGTATCHSTSSHPKGSNTRSVILSIVFSVLVICGVVSCCVRCCLWFKKREEGKAGAGVPPAAASVNRQVRRSNAVLRRLLCCAPATAVLPLLVCTLLSKRLTAWAEAQ